MTGRGQKGMSTVEALAAIALLAVVGTVLMDAMARTTSQRVISSRHLQATEHAMSIVEQLRSGSSEVNEPGGSFEASWHLQSVDDHPGLAHFTVTVRWRAGGERQLALEGLLWRGL